MPVKLRLLIAHPRGRGPMTFAQRGRNEKLPTRMDPYLPALCTREIPTESQWRALAEQLAGQPNPGGLFAFAHLVRTDMPAGPEARVYLDPAQAYGVLVPGRPMNWQERVIAERDELASKLEKLEAFGHSDQAPELPSKVLDLMIWQRNSMRDYLAALNGRIELFAPLSAPPAGPVGESDEAIPKDVPGEQEPAVGAGSEGEPEKTLAEGTEGALMVVDDGLSQSVGEGAGGAAEGGDSTEPASGDVLVGETSTQPANTASVSPDAPPAPDADKSVRAPLPAKKVAKKAAKKKSK